MDEKLDKQSWGAGPWQDEPDRVEFEALGFPCLMHRGGGGAWCGYVAVPPGHPLHGKDLTGAEDDLDVHGGITFASACEGEICHVPKPGEPDDVWWFGFDCAHAWDCAPAYAKYTLNKTFAGTYRDTLQEARRSWTRVFWINVGAGMLNFALSFTGPLPALRAINVGRARDPGRE